MNPCTEGSYDVHRKLHNQVFVILEANCLLGSYVLGVPDPVQASHYTHSTLTNEPHPLPYLLELQRPGEGRPATEGLTLPQ